MENDIEKTQSNASSIIENIEQCINRLSFISDFETIPSRNSKYLSTNFTNFYSKIVDIKEVIVENPQKLINSTTSLTFDCYIQNSEELLNIISENAHKLDTNTRKRCFDKILSLGQENESILLLASIIYQDESIITSLFTKYFTNSFSIFDNDADNNLLNFIRQHIVETIIIWNNKSIINEYIQKISQNSYLLTEFFIRGLNLSVNYPQSINLQYIAPSISYFAQLYISETDKKIPKFCLEQLLISSLISLMSCDTNEFSAYLNSESCIYTINFIFSMDYFHKTLTNLLINKFKQVVPTQVANFIKISLNIMKNSKIFEMNFRFLTVLYDLLNYSNLMMSMTHTIFAYLLPIAKNCENSDYVSIIFDILLNVLINDPKFVISDSENSVFSKLFNKFISFDKMTYLLSRKRKVLDEHLYKLENTTTIPMIFSFSSQKNKMKQLFEILHQLCDFSQENIYKLVDSSLCSIIISLSKSYDEKIIFNGCEIQPIDHKILIKIAIPYLIKLTQTSCSLKIANEILDLIIPQKIYKNYESTSIKYIKSIMDSFNIKLPIIHPLIPKNHIIYDGATFNDLIENGFSISFWLKMDGSIVKRTKNVEFNLFEIFVGEEEFISVKISDSAINVEISQVTKVSSFKIDDKLDMNQWNLFTMSLRKMNDRYKIQTFINKNDAHSSSIPYEEFKNDPIIFQISNKETNLEQLSEYEKYNYIYLTNIIFHKCAFPQNEHKLWYKAGFSYVFCKIQPFFCFPEYKYHFNNLMNIKEVDNNIFLPSFNSLYYFIRNFSVDKLCAMLKSSAKTEEMYLIFIYFLQTVYNFKKDDFELIVSLFEIFNFKIYENLYYLSSNFNNEDRMTYFNDILFNHDFFFKTNEKEISKIFNFIISRCFSQFFDIFTSKGFFRKIITIIRAFYIKNEEKEKNKINFEIFLNNYNSFLQELYKETEDKEDGIISVLENAVSSKEQDLIIYFLKLSAILFDYAPKSQEYVKYLHSVNFTQYRQLLSPLLRSFFFCSGQNFYIRSQVLAYQLPISFSCEMLIDDVREFPVLYSLATLISLKGENSLKKDVARVLFKLTKKSDIVKMIKQLEFWQLWPCIFSLMNDRIIRNDMIYFISKILMFEFNISDFDQTLLLFDLIGLRMNVDSLQCKVELIKIMFDEFFTKTIDENLMNEIWKRSILCLFFQWNFQILLLRKVCCSLLLIEKI